MKNKALLLLLVFALVMTAFFSACTTEAETKTITTTKTATETTITPVIELTYASPYSPPVPYTIADEAWIDYIHEKTEGRVNITPYWGGTLVGREESIPEVAAGVADIGHCVVFSETGYEINNAIMCLFWASPNSAVASRVGREIFEKFPEYQQEFSDLLILGFSTTAYDVLMTNEPIETMEDFKGRAYNADFPTADAIIGFGGTATKIPPPELYTQMEKGLLDGLCFPLETLFGFKFAEVVKYVNLDVQTPNAPIPARMMNRDSFNNLPADIQQIFLDSMVFWEEAQLEAFDAANQKGIDLAEEMGVEFINLSPAELEKWHEALEAVAYERIEGVNAAGKPGTEILEETQRLIKLYTE